jgi:protein-tyrosine phosphatase
MSNLSRQSIINYEKEKTIKPVSVLFVCLGNICRSPSAQAVFETYVENAQLSHLIKVDSCGTAAYHINEPPDPRSAAEANKRGYVMSHLRGRQFTQNDFNKFDYILAMDLENLSSLKFLAPSTLNCHLSLFLEFIDENKVDGQVTEVPDPYYGGDQGFSYVLDLIESASEGLLEHIKKEKLQELIK